MEESTFSLFTEGYLSDEPDTVEGGQADGRTGHGEAMEIKLKDTVTPLLRDGIPASINPRTEATNVHCDTQVFQSPVPAPNIPRLNQSNAPTANLTLADAINNVYKSNNAYKRRRCKKEEA